MAKTKKEEVVIVPNKELIELLRTRVSKLFDREPNGSIVDRELDRLVEDILKIK